VVGLVGEPLRREHRDVVLLRQFGGPVTSGLSAKRSSADASGTMKISVSRIACPQKLMPLGVSCASSPTLALKNCRS